MSVNLTSLVRDIHQTIRETFTTDSYGGVEELIKVFTPAYVPVSAAAPDYLDPVLNPVFTSVSAIIARVDNKEVPNPSNWDKTFDLYINRELVDIDTTSIIEWQGVQYDTFTVINIADAEYVVRVTKL